MIDNPFDQNERILLVPALRPDIALFHAAKADREGNVWIGVRRELMLMAHAATSTVVTVEEICEQSLLDDDLTAAGTIPSLYIRKIAVALGGAKPLGLRGCYETDREHITAYAKAASTEDGFRRYLDENIRQTALRA